MLCLLWPSGDVGVTLMSCYRFFLITFLQDFLAPRVLFPPCGLTPPEGAPGRLGCGAHMAITTSSQGNAVCTSSASRPVSRTELKELELGCGLCYCGR